jgi:hypothetical protein
MLRSHMEQCVPGSWTVDLLGELSVGTLREIIDASDVLTSWTTINETFTETDLPGPVARPLLVTPVATEIEPIGTL